MASRRTVTVLFTDLVESTRLMMALPSSQAEELRGRHFQQMRNALAVHKGREIKTIGDAFMVAFEAAGDALGCAVTMQRLVDRDAGASGHPLALRVGVSTGDVTEAEGDFFGIPVIEASRLCALAERGQILVTDVALAVTGEVGSRPITPLGPLELKGLDRPVPVSAVGWADAADETLRVALVDDTAILRRGIANTLVNCGIDVVLEAGDTDGLDAQLDVARPHVVVLDVRMPPTFTTEGLDAARRIKSERPAMGVIVLSSEVQADAARDLLSGGTEGIGYLLKDRVGDIDQLVEAIRTVARGGSVIDPEVIAELTPAPS
jgi:class 3 adenylate cyclase